MLSFRYNNTTPIKDDDKSLGMFHFSVTVEVKQSGFSLGFWSILSGRFSEFQNAMLECLTSVKCMIRK